MVANTDIMIMVIFIAEYVKYDFENNMDQLNKNTLENRQKHRNAKKAGVRIFSGSCKDCYKSHF